MYSYEERIRAIKFYINCGYNAAYTVRKLGYPDVSQIPRWYKEYINNKDLHKERVKWFKYSDKEKRLAVDYSNENSTMEIDFVIQMDKPRLLYRFLFFCHNKRPPYDKIFYHRRPFDYINLQKKFHTLSNATCIS